MCYNSERGEHNQQPRKWARDGIQQIGLVLQGSTVQAWVVRWAARCPWTSPIMWTSALSRILNSTRGLEPLQQQPLDRLLNCTLNCSNKLKRIVPVTMLRNLNLVLNFESIHLVFCLKVFVWYFVWKYSFGILFESIYLVFCLKVFVWYFVWKYSFGILFESIRLLFCVYNDSRCQFDICYYGHSELWTMNCSKLSFELWYELLWGIKEVNVCVSVTRMTEIKNYKMKHLVCNWNRCICKYQWKYQWSKLMLWWLVRY